MFEPAQIGLKKATQIGCAIFQHGEAVNAHTKGKALIFFRINAGMAQYMRIDHARAANLHPIIAFTDDQLIAVTIALHVYFHARLGKGEIAGAEANGDILDLEKRCQKSFQCVFQMAHMGGLIDYQPFDLMEHWRMRLVAIAAISATRRDKAERRAAFVFLPVLHGAHLHRRGMGTQQKRFAVFLGLHVKRVMHLPRRMRVGNVQSGEIVKLAFNIGPRCHVKTHIGKNCVDFFHRLADRMNAPLKLCIGRNRQCHIQCFFAQSCVQRGAVERSFFRLNGIGNLVAQ